MAKMKITVELPYGADDLLAMGKASVDWHERGVRSEIETGIRSDTITVTSDPDMQNHPNAATVLVWALHAAADSVGHARPFAT